MRLKNQNPDRPSAGLTKNGERGQAIVECALILLVFLASLIGAIDFGQLLFKHQLLVERVRAGIRWGSVNAWDGTGDQIANVVRYASVTVPEGGTPFLGLTRANILAVHSAGSISDPNDERLTVSIVDFDFNFLSPWIAKTYRGNYAVRESAPLFYRP
ncbi:MAG TPA: TadE family protein [Bryobacteraceae bacterium]|jgi:TadE-like protein|nr:TadE family protein [Bryobacteraceae bacterium]